MVIDTVNEVESLKMSSQIGDEIGDLSAMSTEADSQTANEGN